jgi:hypothetical protein
MMKNTNESAYQVLIDKDSRRRAIDANLSRLEKTKNILSGGMNRRPPAPPSAVTPLDTLPRLPATFSANPFPAPPAGYQPNVPSGFFGPPPVPMSRQSSRSSSRRHHHHRRRQRYDDDASSDSDSSDASISSDLQRMIDRKLKEHAPDHLRHIIMDDIQQEMKHMSAKGYALPAGYDPSKHSLDENEIKLYQQQALRERKREQKKVTVLLGFAANGLSWFCRAMKFDWIKVKHLPSLIRDSIEEGEFEEFAEGVGESLRGTILDHPLCSTAIKFLEKVGEAHQQETEEETENLGKREETRKERSRQFVQGLKRAGQQPPGQKEPMVNPNPLMHLPKPTPKPIPPPVPLPVPVSNESAVSTSTATSMTPSESESQKKTRGKEE